MRERSHTSQTARPALACLSVFHKPQFDSSSGSITYKQNQAIEAPTGIFGVPLQVSIKYANVAISLTDSDGKSFIYGYVPIVVAKCGVFLKEKATDIEGIFRLSGSAKRIKDLQAIFNSPDRYGKGLDWTGYTVHDAANILRRYLNQLPEPIIPLEFYDRFRDPIRNHAMQAVGDTEAQADDVGDFDNEAAIKIYQQLITQLPPLNRQLLLYILDLLAVFASKSDLNRMTSANLSAIFQPGLLSHPTHDMSPAEYRLSQDVLIFLIENQDHFLIGMTGTAADDKTMREVEAGSPQPSTPTTPLHGRTKSNIVRSSSSGSAAAEDVRKHGGIRRNVSVSSKHSRHSNGAPSSAGSPYATPHTASTPTMGVHRSNTVPSKKSPALGTARFSKPSDPPTPTSTGLSPLGLPNVSPFVYTTESIPPAVKANDEPAAETTTPPPDDPTSAELLQHPEPTPVADMPQGGLLPQTPSSATRKEQKVLITPSKERNLSALFSRTPMGENEKKDGRSPNKLRKRRAQESAGESAQSSNTSLAGQSGDSPTSPRAPAESSQPASAVPLSQHQDQPQLNTTAPPPELSNTQATPTTEVPPQTPRPVQNPTTTQTQKSTPQQSSGATLKPNLSPTPSNRSHSSITSQSDLDRGDPAPKVEKKRRSRWRLSQKLPQQQLGSDTSSSALVSNAVAGASATSIGSGGRPKKNLTHDSQQITTDPPVDPPSSIQNSESDAAGSSIQAEKRGPLGWLKAKMNDRKEEKKEKEAEKGRAKSPPPSTEAFGLRKSLQASREAFHSRGRSVELMREAESGSKADHAGEKANPSQAGLT
ncbi:hypothetical protein FGG08_003943 [Glutinoglossum americanum]|uniref:Rho-GAP domain-containing protein n=1 Tax=Glutinoglossum americanum TaxID=1670608 RepID=A0A9P8L035_9PEZI|nr:hypothetical protein FGG08_003943 [Glutinoglossum americanum]